ncbi:MAG: hypothetical protein CVV21_02955 [Candidatus Goldiibacteriota bacterium HGW-Goldbacteria-1]|jgi:AcrR family transcriptional regulator|nr:MAG: hypothetical protein CVV21_02955 [Candidatus Goldiibacteriota bacterium HGW-Goldbacteria-1]
MTEILSEKSITPKGRGTKERIFETAVELFSKDGFSCVSIRDITSSAGLKESSLYHHFTNKEELLSEIYFYFAENINATRLSETDMTRILNGGSGYDLLNSCLLEFRQVMEQPLMARVWRIVTMEQYRDVKAFEILSIDFHKMRIKYYENIFRMLIKKRLIKTLDPKLLAFEYFYTLIGMLTEYNVLKFYKKKTDVIENLMSEHINFFWNKIKNN